MTPHLPPPSPPAPLGDIAACEAALGVTLPAWLRDRLTAENGWQVDDRNGATHEEWRFLPVLDRTDRRQRTRTAEDIAWHTRKLRAADSSELQGAVVVARAWDEKSRLILLPDPAAPAVLAPTLWRQYALEAPSPEPVDLDGLGRQPEAVGNAPLRTRDELPFFRFHPDPVATGSIIENPDAVCPCCSQRTGWAYPQEPYGLDPQPVNLCPWCIADGRAAATYESEFACEFDGDVPQASIDEVNLRTPGFESWEGERWLSHCDDVAVFLGPAGILKISQYPSAMQALIDDDFEELDLPLAPGEDIDAFLFRCLHCGTHLAYLNAC